MLAIATVLAALLVSMVITRIATVALAVTGLSRESARFQARSAFTGVGFTTNEAESVVNHPVRRRVVLLLMLLGNAGFVTVLGSLLISFSGADSSTEAWRRIVLLLGGLVVLLLLAGSKGLDRAMSRFIRALLDRFTTLDVRDYAELLQLAGGYGVVELNVNDDHWTAGKSLEQLQIRKEGIAVLGIQRPSQTFAAVPKGASVIEPGDTLLLYGHTRELGRFGERRAGPEGDAEHVEQMRRHEGEIPASE